MIQKIISVKKYIISAKTSFVKNSFYFEIMPVEKASKNKKL